MGFPVGSDGKESAHKMGDLGSIPSLGRSLEEGHGNPLQYSCPENPHGQRSLAGYSPWGCKESDMTEQVSTSAVLNCSKSHVEATIIEQMVAVVVILLLIAIFFSTNVKILPVLILSHLYIIIAKTYYSTYHVTAKSLTVCHINQGGVSS